MSQDEQSQKIPMQEIIDIAEQLRDFYLQDDDPVKRAKRQVLIRYLHDFIFSERLKSDIMEGHQEKSAILYKRNSDCLEYYGQDGNELKYLGSMEADWIDKLSKKQCDALLEIFREAMTDKTGD